jgi:hypothetical protein
MTITRPWRRMTLQCSQMGLTEGLTFIGVFLSLSSYRLEGGRYFSAVR